MVVESELDFGNSWKEASTCPDVSTTPDPCSKNPHRRAWAEKQCSIIKASTFQTCHGKVGRGECRARLWAAGGCPAGWAGTWGSPTVSVALSVYTQLTSRPVAATPNPHPPLTSEGVDRASVETGLGTVASPPVSCFLSPGQQVCRRQPPRDPGKPIPWQALVCCPGHPQGSQTGEASQTQLSSGAPPGGPHALLRGLRPRLLFLRLWW